MTIIYRKEKFGVTPSLAASLLLIARLRSRVQVSIATKEGINV